MFLESRSGHDLELKLSWGQQRLASEITSGLFCCSIMISSLYLVKSMVEWLWRPLHVCMLKLESQYSKLVSGPRALLIHWFPWQSNLRDNLSLHFNLIATCWKHFISIILEADEVFQFGHRRSLYMFFFVSIKLLPVVVALEWPYWTSMCMLRCERACLRSLKTQ